MWELTFDFVDVFTLVVSLDIVVGLFHVLVQQLLSNLSAGLRSGDITFQALQVSVQLVIPLDVGLFERLQGPFTLNGHVKGAICEVHCRLRGVNK